MSIDIIHICGAAFIFLCHACNESGNSIGGMVGQLFSIGVPIFFIISGYLHGQKEAPQNKLKWYGKKLKRLLCPLYIFIAVLAVLYLVTGLQIDLGCWLQSVIPICGLTQKYIPGCGHLWFLTHMLICYFLTPIMQKRAQVKNSEIFAIGFIWLSACTLLAYIAQPIWCTLLNSLLSYAVGFYVLPRLLCKKYKYSVLFGAAIFSCLCRLVCRHFFDDTPFYNSVATEICSLILAVSIIVFLFQFGKLLEESANVTVKKFVSALSKRTYEFYLVHYIFLNGPMKIELPNYLQSVLIALMLSLVFSEFVHLLSIFFNRKLVK